MTRPAYKGRALWSAPRPARRGRMRPGWIALALLAVAAVAWLERDVLARTAPYRALLTVRQVDVEGTTFLGEGEVRRAAGLDRPVDYLRVDLERAQTKLEKLTRVEKATITRALPRRILIRVVERQPVLLVRAGRLLEADRRGVILPPLVSGVAADVPLVDGVRVKDARAGRRITDPRFARALRHLDALQRPSIALGHPVSEIDVTAPGTTIVTLGPDGVDVLLPGEPPSERPLSALRVVLADLVTRGQSASRIDLRGEEVIAVRPIPAAGSPADSLSVKTREPRRG